MSNKSRTVGFGMSNAMTTVAYRLDEENSPWFRLILPSRFADFKGWLRIGDLPLEVETRVSALLIAYGIHLNETHEIEGIGFFRPRASFFDTDPDGFLDPAQVLGWICLDLDYNDYYDMRTASWRQHRKVK